MPKRKMYLSVLCLLSVGLACAQTGVIGTYAGNGSAGFSGDGGMPASAMLNGPARLALDSNGNLFVADSSNSRIRKVSGGVITIVAGGGAGGDGGLATAAQLQNLCDVKVDSVGNLYISESCLVASGGTGGGVPAMSRIRRVDAATGIITTIAGGNNWGFAVTADRRPARSGNINLPASTSPAITLTVMASTSIVLVSSVNPSTPGQAVTFTATLSPSTASGTFQFSDNGSAIGTVSTMSGPATFSISTLSSGTHSIIASYFGDLGASYPKRFVFLVTGCDVFAEPRARGRCRNAYGVGEPRHRNWNCSVR